MHRMLLKVMCFLLAVLLPVSALADPLQMNSQQDMPDQGTFLEEGADPVYYKNHSEGYWLYISDTVRVEITRYQSTKPHLTYYIADLQCAEGTSLYTINSNEVTGKKNNYPQNIALAGRAVFAQSGDFYSYRVSHDKYPGIIIRNGKILYKKSYTRMIYALPNLATMAFYPSGKAEVNEAWEVTAKQYIDKGASTVVAFGPILIRNGEIQSLDNDAYDNEEPRCCIGVVDKGHYIALLVEGRKSHSDGASLATCAEILSDFGCWDALNLDGGNTAAMLFMGESVQMNELGGVDENDRAIPDVLCIGSY